MAGSVLGGGTFTLRATASPGVTPSATVSHSSCNSTALVFLNQTTENEDVQGPIKARVSAISGTQITVVADRQLTDTLSGYYGIFAKA